MEKNNYQKGIGVIVSLIIVAVIAFGGYGVYKMSTQQKAEVSSDTSVITEQEKEVVAEVRGDVVETLGSVKASLVLTSQASIDSAIKALNDLTARVDQAVLEVQGEAQSEILTLKAEVETLKKKLRNRSGGSSGSNTNTTDSEPTETTIEVDIDTIIEDVQADIEADSEAEVENEEETEGDSVDSEDEAESADEDTSSGEVEVEAEVEVNSN